MKTVFTLFCLSLAVDAHATGEPSIPTLQAQPLAPSVLLNATRTASKPAAMHRVPAPSISQTSVTRRPDGSLVMNCVQRPNPKLAQQMAAQQSAARSAEPQQP